MLHFKILNLMIKVQYKVLNIKQISTINFVACSVVEIFMNANSSGRIIYQTLKLKVQIMYLLKKPTQK